MHSRIDDRWLWLGFGVFLVVAVKGIRYAIKDVIRLTELEPYHENLDDAHKERPEDNISLDDLKILAESPNTNIANAAISLVLDRVQHHRDARRSIMKEADSKDEHTRRRARGAVAFLRNWPLPFISDSDLPHYSRSRSNSGSNSSSISMPALEDIQPARDARGNLPDAPAIDVVIPSIENPVAGWTSVPRERPAENETERRRRRREAMVLREGEGGVEEGDIIRPRLPA